MNSGDFPSLLVLFAAKYFRFQGQDLSQMDTVAAVFIIARLILGALAVLLGLIETKSDS